ncbi:hypothetical protein E2C01_006337 [Portunus trituberculatus]|uniref:Uncharacterized protein n=1 Tax=Portunus trituberculatus TaxID=210409 RepID=A0A5B7CW23_PORTR|nr:hypothetical protein [Portunus trituberculatus]
MAGMEWQDQVHQITSEDPSFDESQHYKAAYNCMIVLAPQCTAGSESGSSDVGLVSCRLALHSNTPWVTFLIFPLLHKAGHCQW